MNLRASLEVQNAAWREATRAHEAETDLSHVFLGLLALGGPGAATLGAEGIGLASGRRALQTLRSSRLEALGIAANIPTQQPRPVHELNRRDAGHVPLTDAAEQFLQQHSNDSDTQLLLALVTDPDSGIPALIQQQGVSPARVREQLHTVTDAAGPVTRGDFSAPDSTSLPTLPGVQLRRYVSCDTTTALTVAARADLAKQWLPFAQNPTCEGPDRIIGTHKGRHGRVEQLHDDPVVWAETWDAAPSGWWQIEVRPSPGGCYVTLTRTLHTHGFLARVAARVGQSMQAWTLTHALHDFAYTCADLQAPTCATP